MNKVDELIKKVEDEKAREEAEARKEVSRLYGLGVEAIEGALREGLEEDWVRELVGENDWNEMAKGEVMSRNVGRDGSIMVGVRLGVNGEAVRLASMYFTVEMRSFSDGSLRTGEVNGMVKGNSGSMWKVPEMLVGLLVRAREVWLERRVDELRLELGRPWLFVYEGGAVSASRPGGGIRVLKLEALKEGERIRGLLMELAPEYEERWDQGLEWWNQWVDAEWLKLAKDLEWAARKPGVLAEYEAAYGDYYVRSLEFEEMRKRVWAELQEAVDEPYKVWQLTFCGLCQTPPPAPPHLSTNGEGSEPVGVFERIWALAPEADGEGYWLVIDGAGKDVVIKRRFWNLVAIDEGKVVRPTEGHATVQSTWSDVFEGYLYFPPGREAEAIGLLEEVEGEVREFVDELPKRPKEPEGCGEYSAWDWGELEEVRKVVENRVMVEGRSGMNAEPCAPTSGQGVGNE